MKYAPIALLALVLAGPAAAACIDRVDASKATGIDAAELTATICGASVMRRVLDSATVRDSMTDPTGENLFVKYLPDIKAGRMTEGDALARSAKLVDIEFQAGGILTFSKRKLQRKIERYMAETFVALFKQPVPLARVRISALYPMSSGKDERIYRTTVRNDGGKYGPESLPVSWSVWAHPSLLAR